MALLLTSVFGVTGCGSDDDVQAGSRVKNAAPEASGASDAPSEADCDRRKEFMGSYDFLRTLEQMNLDERHSYDSLLDDLELLEELELHDDLDLDDLDRLDRVYYKLLEYIEFLDDLAPLHEIRDRLAKCDVSDDWDLWPNMSG